MMENNIRERYKEQKTPAQQALEYQLSLKHNTEYKKRVQRTFLQIASLFVRQYPNVSIEPPRGREKSENSIRNKIYNLEMERLCKLYALQDISQEEIKEFYNIIIEKARRQELQINALFYQEMPDIETISKLVEEEEIEDNLKTTLLQVYKTRLQTEPINHKKEIEAELDRKYGALAKENLLRWEEIEKVKQNPKELKRLHNPVECLKIKDLRGFKIVIASVPEEIATKNEHLKRLVKKREHLSEEQKIRYDDLRCIAIEREFAQALIQNESLLKKMNLNVIDYKEKDKDNGYIADHIKFSYRDCAMYTFEFQLRSLYREALSRANGSAAHDKRAGKKRIFPSMSNKKEFVHKLNSSLPQYTILTRENQEFEIRECSMEENMLEYYLEYADIDYTQYEKAIEYIKEEREKSK